MCGSIFWGRSIFWSSLLFAAWWQFFLGKSQSHSNQVSGPSWAISVMSCSVKWNRRHRQKSEVKKDEIKLEINLDFKLDFGQSSVESVVPGRRLDDAKLQVVDRLHAKVHPHKVLVQPGTEFENLFWPPNFVRINFGQILKHDLGITNSEGGSPGRVYMGWDLLSEGPGFESQHRILDAHFSH